ncbi:hypothetical protein RHSIM_Rhsim09G0092500 [Rhododendron simsii]|uniref:Uncharacterized protein n=1 Tax=Rhododendron simsii TaxID=118357 RepID=A0A834GKM1_RHOSS|nr:hypothetical protein RHSIM_Rhsim09G0092500 [Rhododendron simsii]
MGRRAICSLGGRRSPASSPGCLSSFLFCFTGVPVWAIRCHGFTVAGALFNCLWGLQLSGLTTVGWRMAVVSPCICFVLGGEGFCRSGVVGSQQRRLPIFFGIYD